MNGRNSFTEFYKNLHLHGIYKNFFGYDKAQIKREAKKNDSTDSNDKKQQQHSAEQQKPDPETTRETEKIPVLSYLLILPAMLLFMVFSHLCY